MEPGDLDIRTLRTADEMAMIGVVFQQVWGTNTPIVPVELLMAISHAGGYVAGAFDGDRAMGASIGFLAEHEGQRALHSHVTGILPGLQHGGLGRTMKNHQRAWAVERGIPWIVWTFDPLVRANAWFNIEVLGAQVTDYIENFYGTMADTINVEDETDRLVIAWPTDGDTEPGDGPATSRRGDEILVPTPEDIVMLRRTDPTEAAAWRRRVRDQLAPALAAGGSVVGYTRDGEYVVAP